MPATIVQPVVVETDVEPVDPTMDLLEAVAQALVLVDDGDFCCGQRDEQGRCCMTARARVVLAAIENFGGPTADEIEGIACGDYIIAAEVRREH